MYLSFFHRACMSHALSQYIKTITNQRSVHMIYDFQPGGGILNTRNATTANFCLKQVVFITRDYTI